MYARSPASIYFLSPLSFSQVPNPFISNYLLMPATGGLTAETDAPPWSDFRWEASPSDDVYTSSLHHIASVLRDRMTGRDESSVETLHYTGKTVRKVMETLQVCGRNVPQSVLFAVSGLASGSVCLT